MKVVGIVPSPSAVVITRLDSTSTGVTCDFHEEWNLSASDRLSDYVAVRTRLVEKLQQWRPDAVCIAAFEPFALTRGRAQASWFKTAEVRGVMAEAARSAVSATELRSKQTTRTSMGNRRTDDCVMDDLLWSSRLSSDIPKKYRESALLALSWIDQNRK